MNSARLALIRLLAALPLCACLIQAHPVHQSHAEVDYNAESGALEVSLTVFLSDLETVLSLQAGKPLVLGQTEPGFFDAQARAYLARTFVVRNAAGQTLPHAWLGSETASADGKSGEPEMTFYFEIPLPGGLAGCSLRPAVLCEQFDDQVNLLRMQGGLKKSVWCFLPGDPGKKLTPQ